ncbi:unnamed protein product [Protopolystoma xenopodis]|uniref:Uncharacterized protein n=1 Tax=Protopolystoma xenopodis TaxID=117903 RepID=A0A3S5BVF6_9PLAT|nr:unnamed protein product [Protopolystoma xenopodis]
MGFLTRSPCCVILFTRNFSRRSHCCPAGQLWPLPPHASLQWGAVDDWPDALSLNVGVHSFYDGVVMLCVPVGPGQGGSREGRRRRRSRKIKYTWENETKT